MGAGRHCPRGAGAAAAAGVSRCRLGLPAVSRQHHDHRRDRGARAQSADRLQRPVLAGSRRVLRGRRVHGGDPDGQAERALLGDDSGGGHRVLYRRVPVRPAGAQARGALSRPCDLRPGARGAADPQIQVARRPDRRRAGHRADEAGGAVRPAAQRGPVALLLLPAGHDRAVLGRVEHAEQPQRSRHDGDPRPVHGGRHDGHRHGALQDGDLRHQRGIHRHCRCALGLRHRVRRARQLRHFPVDQVPDRPGRGRHRLAVRICARRHLLRAGRQFGAVADPVHPQRPRPAVRPLGLHRLRCAADRNHLPDADGHRRRALHGLPQAARCTGVPRASSSEGRRKAAFFLAKIRTKLRQA